jgi:hypothetical protein
MHPPEAHPVCFEYRAGVKWLIRGASKRSGTEFASGARNENALIALLEQQRGGHSRA